MCGSASSWMGSGCSAPVKTAVAVTSRSPAAGEGERGGGREAGSLQSRVHLQTAHRRLAEAPPAAANNPQTPHTAQRGRDGSGEKGGVPMVVVAAAMFSCVEARLTHRCHTSG